jgi:hypothetical protein
MRSLAVAMLLLLQDAALDRKIADLLPTREEEKWLTVPWRTSLLQARRDANDAGKPIFLWLMDGDPLGCT